MARSDLIIIATLFSIIIPLILLVWVLKMGFRSKGELLLKSLGAYLALIALYQVNNWAFYSYYLAIWWLMLPVLFVVYKFSMKTEILWIAKPDWPGWIGIAASLVLVAFSIPVIFQSQAAKTIPENAVEMEFPLKGWRYYIAHGGSRPLVNAHMNVQDNKPYRGQTWALDILQMGWLGNRARGVYPETLSRYHIFNQPVYAPCSGEVTATENELTDLIPPEADRENLPGNYVQIRCEPEVYVILAHLKKHSVLVETGDIVETGEPLGKVGNSGNTSEPHLHIHAQSGAGGESLLNADPLPMIFTNFGFPVRNDIVRNR
ncbi:MAG: M23 family metallopeptidase [Balneolaceae bacterium]